MKDSLLDWLAIRAELAGMAVSSPAVQVLSQRDGHARFLDEHVRSRDPLRFERMSRALALMRSHARARRALDFELLASWQNLVLDREQSPFRTTPAFAKQGRERYCIDPLTRRRFESCLREADELDAALCLRAARAYLDVLFFHPFDDGNARAAALTLDFLLAREGLVLHQVAPLFVVARRADDEAGAMAFVRLLELLVSMNGARTEVHSGSHRDVSPGPIQPTALVGT